MTYHIVPFLGDRGSYKSEIVPWAMKFCSILTLLVQKVENLFWCLNNVHSTSWSEHNSWFLTNIFSDFRSPKWKLHICVGGVKESNFLLERSRIQSRFLTGKKNTSPWHIALAVRYTMSWENWFYCMNQTRNWKLLA